MMGSIGWPELLVIIAIGAVIWWIVAVRRRL
jgi:Sec-independent protein translocase protein TatA